jgi:hypothetical protein
LWCGVLLGETVAGSFLTAGFKQVVFNQEMALQAEVYSLISTERAYAAAMKEDADNKTQAAIFSDVAKHRYVYPVIQAMRSPLELPFLGIDPAAERTAYAATLAWEKHEDTMK